MYELAGRPYSTDDGLRGAVAQTGGSIQSGPGPITIDGRPGKMVVSTFPAGASGYARYAIVQVGDRAFLWFSAIEGSDPAAGEQAFADLIASIQID